MSNQLHQAMTDILAMPYFKNQHAQSQTHTHGHERAVADKLVANGFTEVNRKTYPKVKKDILKKWVETNDDTKLKTVTVGILPGSFILQPANSQSYPDILVYDFTNRYIALECKSGKGVDAPMWNDSFPLQNGIYIYASGILNETTVFFGRDVIDPQVYEERAKYQAEIQLLNDKYDVKVKELDHHKRGWALRSRPQNFQQGGKALANYFTHEDRAMCESNVLGYAQL